MLSNFLVTVKYIFYSQRISNFTMPIHISNVLQLLAFLLLLKVLLNKNFYVAILLGS